MTVFADVSKLAEPQAVWSELVSSSPNAWVWASWLVHRFRIEHLVSAGIPFQDVSFVAIEKDVPVGLAPFVLVGSGNGHDQSKEASYLGAPLPWPCVRFGAEERVERLVFDEIERRAMEAGASKICLMLSPPFENEDCKQAFFRTVRERKFIDASYQSHLVAVNADFFSTIRPKYRQNIRKYQSKYELTVVAGPDFPIGLPQEYMELHVKDSGARHRSLATYQKQFDIIRAGEGICVSAYHKDACRTVGMLMIWLLKGAAYDASVAVEPEFQHEPVSNLLKWKGILELLDRGVAGYDLGEISSSPEYLRQPSEKNYGISFFKDGWSRGKRKTVYVAEKYYRRESLTADWHQKLTSLFDHFEI